MQFQKYTFFCQYILFCSLVFQDVPSVNALIGHGIKAARLSDFPFIAGIVRHQRDFDIERDLLCTASLISPQDILTASHCFDDETREGLRIIVGNLDISYRQSSYYAAWWITYYYWAASQQTNNDFTSNDIAILRLTRKVPHGVTADLSYISYSQLKDKKIVTAGWGETNNGSYPHMLLTMKTKVIHNDECVRRAAELCGNDYYMEPNIVCSAGNPFRILMGGDSGGPVVFNNKLIGINTATCPLPNQRFHPDKVNLHTTLKFYRQFITDVLYM